MESNGAPAQSKEMADAALQILHPTWITARFHPGPTRPPNQPKSLAPSALRSLALARHATRTNRNPTPRPTFEALKPERKRPTSASNSMFPFRTVTGGYFLPRPSTRSGKSQSVEEAVLRLLRINGK